MSPSTRTDTRDRLLDAAEQMINRHGFAATSIDRIIAAVDVTKGTFFYHFKSKADLARALIERFAAKDREVLMSSLERAERLSEDPVQQVLIFAGLMLEVAEQVDAAPQPGCLFATYCYESGLFDSGTNQVIADALLQWRRLVGAKLRAAAEAQPPVVPVDMDSLADMITVVFEGAFVSARTLGGKTTVADQVRHFRNYLQLLFAAA